ncbi:transposase [Marivita lacus]|uniref:transposase n=1 Tax=Marivita lacus TaxID=1323742 RepID=UPI00166A8CA8
MSWHIALTDKRGPQQSYVDDGIRSYLSRKMLFGMGLSQTTGFVGNLLHLIRRDWTIPLFRMLMRHRRERVSCPAPGSHAPRAMRA